MGEVYEKGQVLIPKYIRDMFNIKPGSQVSFRVENNKIILDPADDWIKEFRELRSQLKKRSFKDTEKAIKEAEESMHDEWLNVPGR